MSNKSFLVFCVLLGFGCAATAAYTAESVFDVVDKKKVAKVAMVNVGEIDREALAPVLRTLKLQVAAGSKELFLRINSNGGSIFAGMEFIQDLEQFKKKGVRIKCVVDARAISMGFVILQAACDERLATERAFFLAHNGSISQTGGGEQDLQEDVDLLNTMNESMALICSKRMGMTLEAYQKKLKERKSWIFGAAKALQYSAIDAIIAVEDLPPLYEDD